ncbi:MAG: nucleotide exchange factor GrpE [bacterium]
MKDDNKDIKNEEETTVEDTQENKEITEEFVPEDEDGNPAVLIKKLREKIKKLEGEKQEYLTGWQRARADYSNFKKETEENRANLIGFANKNLLQDLMPVLESFDMAIGNKEAWEKVDFNWRMGVEYIANQLKRVMEDNGLVEINPVGQTFNPAQHEAVEHIAVDKKEDDHKVVSVIKKGYILKGTVITPAKVKVGDFKE